MAARRPPTLLEPLVAWAGVTATVSVLYHLRSVGFVRENLHAIAAALFLVVPQALLTLRPPLDPDEAYGLRLGPLARGLKYAALFALAILPLYALGFWGWFKVGCAKWPLQMAANCAHLARPTWGLPPDFGLVALGQLIVVAAPEELFFRGYLTTRLEAALGGPRLRVLGVEMGRGTLLASALFAFGHLLVTFEPATLATFFPAFAFAWIYARTRSVVGGALFHAACNLTVDVLAFSLVR